MSATAGPLEIAKNGREVIKASLSEKYGRSLASLWVFARQKDGTLVPCKGKGLSFDRALLPQIEDAVRALREQDDALAGES